MSDWSSFPDHKGRHDKWREFLSEDKNKSDKEQLNEVSFLQSIGLQKMDPEEQKQINALADKIVANPDALPDDINPKTGARTAHAIVGSALAKYLQMFGIPTNNYNALYLMNALVNKFSDLGGGEYTDRIDLLVPAIKRASKQIKQNLKKQAEENPEAATADPDAPQPESGQASVRVGQTVRNLAGHLMTMDQAKLVQALVIRALNKAGYGKVIRMDESKSSKLLRRFLKDPKVLYEIATSGYSHAASQQPQRQARRTSQTLPVIDLSSVGIKPENQAKVKNILDRMLASVGIQVEFGPARSQGQSAAAAEPTAAAAEPTAAEPEAATAEPTAAEPGSFDASRSDIEAVLKHTSGPRSKMGPAARFKLKLSQYLRGVEGISGATAGRNSPLVNGIVKVIRDVMTQMGRGPKEIQESIDEIFIPMVLEEVKKEHTSRIVLEETQKFLSERPRGDRQWRRDWEEEEAEQEEDEGLARQKADQESSSWAQRAKSQPQSRAAAAYEKAGTPRVSKKRPALRPAVSSRALTGASDPASAWQSDQGTPVEFPPIEQPQSKAKPEAPEAAAEPKAAAAEPKAPPAEPKAAAAEPKAPPAEPKAAAAEPEAAAAEPEAAAAPTDFTVSRSDIQAALKHTSGPRSKMGPAARFKLKLSQYLRGLEGVPATAAGRNSPLVDATVNVIRDVMSTMGYSAGAIQESIDKVFLPAILQEIKKERTRRIIIEETQRVLNEKK